MGGKAKAYFLVQGWVRGSIKAVLGRTYMFFLYKHSVFQSEARICLSFSQIELQNMLKICLSKNIQNNKFYNLTHALEERNGLEYHNEEIFELVPSSPSQLLNPTT